MGWPELGVRVSSLQALAQTLLELQARMPPGWRIWLAAVWQKQSGPLNDGTSLQLPTLQAWWANREWLTAELKGVTKSHRKIEKVRIR